MKDNVIFSGCGTVCNDCGWYNGEKNPKCPGCRSVKGKPFWGTCKLYECMKEKSVEHCGLCKEFPCDLFMDSFDPSEGPVSTAVRAGILAYRAKHGDEKAVQYARNIEH